MQKLLYIIGFLTFLSSTGFCQGGNPDCYYPTPGNGIDTMFRKLEQGWGIGDGLLDLGADAVTGNQRIISLGIHGNLPNHTVLESGSLVKLKNLAVTKKWNIDLSQAIFGHFHSTKVLDAMISSIIYWADENGNFDSTRHSYLRSSVHGDRYTEEFGRGFYFGTINPCVGMWTNDSLDDIILIGNTEWSTQQKRQDSSRIYALLYTSNNLKTISPIIFNDSSAKFREDFYDTVQATGKVYLDFRQGITGYFSGQDHKDVLAVDGFGNIFYYRNSGGFSLAGLVKSLRFDTLLAAWQNPHLNENQRFLQNSIYARFAMRVLPKPNWDHSDDFVARFTTNDDRNDYWFFYQGGSTFGSKRLLIDSPDFQIRPPSGNGFGYAYSIFNCGDMTGTGNPVLRIRGNDRYSGREYYYVMGNAIDNKIDMSVQQDPGYAADGPVLIDADGDNLQDILYQVNNQGGDSLQRYGTSLWVLHGSKQIPVHITSVEGRNLSPTNGFSVYPNPANAETTIRYNGASDGYYSLSLFDLLGRKVYHSSNHLSIGENTLNIRTEKLPQGIYSIVFEGGDVRLTEKIVISH